MTGGLKTLDKVTVYNSKGWVEDLPSLKTGRYYHACGSFVTSDKKMVSLELNNVILAIVIVMLLSGVSGGWRLPRHCLHRTADRWYAGLDHDRASPPSSVGTAGGLNHCQ